MLLESNLWLCVCQTLLEAEDNAFILFLPQGALHYPSPLFPFGRVNLVGLSIIMMSRLVAEFSFNQVIALGWKEVISYC